MDMAIIKKTCSLPTCNFRGLPTYGVPNISKSFDRYATWMKLVGRPDLLVKSRKEIRKQGYKLCRAHFNDDDIEECTGKLKETAIPSKHLPQIKPNEDLLDIIDAPICKKNTCTVNLNLNSLDYNSDMVIKRKNDESETIIEFATSKIFGSPLLISDTAETQNGNNKNCDCENAKKCSQSTRCFDFYFDILPSETENNNNNKVDENTLSDYELSDYIKKIKTDQTFCRICLTHLEFAVKFDLFPVDSESAAIAEEFRKKLKHIYPEMVFSNWKSNKHKIYDILIIIIYIFDADEDFIKV